MGKVIFMFPGQGSQYPGMGKDLYDKYDIAKEVFHKAQKFMGKDFLEMIFEGDEDVLMKTENTQPAIYTVSVAALETIRHLGIMDYDMVMGHSLGEFSALYAAGVVDFLQGLKLVKIRGELMAEANKGGGMAAIIGMDEKDIAQVVNRYPNVIIANYNSPGQIVISGSTDELNSALEELKPHAKRIIPLKVSGAFHSPMMEEAARKFSRYLNKDEMNPPKVPIIMNVTGRAATTLDEVHSALVKQLTGSVRFIDMTNTAYEMGARKFVEVGPGKVLQGLVRRILRDKKDVEITGSEALL